MARYIVEDEEGNQFEVEDEEAVQETAPETSWTDRMLETVPFVGTALANSPLGDTFREQAPRAVDNLMGMPGRAINAVGDLLGGGEDMSGEDWLNAGLRGGSMVAGGALGAFGGPAAIPLGVAGGGWLYDRMQEWGTPNPQPFADSLTDLATIDIPDTYAGYGMAKLFPEMGRVSNLYDKEKALRGAVSTNPDDYITSSGRMSVADAIDEVRPTGMLDDPALLKSDNPFSDLSAANKSLQDGLGFEIDQTLDNTNTRVPFQKLDPRRTLDDPEFKTRSEENARSRVANEEFENLSQRSLRNQFGPEKGEALYQEYTQLRSEQAWYKAQQQQMDLDGQLGDPRIPTEIQFANLERKRQVFGDNLNALNGRIAEIEHQISKGSFSASETAAMKRAWDEKRDYGKATEELSDRSTAFGELGNKARTEMYGAVDSPGFESANNAFAASKSLEGPLGNRARVEQFTQKPGMMSRGWDMIKNPIRTMFSDSPYSTGNPNTLLRMSQGQTLPQRAGDWIQGTRGAMNRAAPFAGGATNMLMSPFDAQPTQGIDPAPDALSVNLVPPAPTEVNMDFTVPRSLSVIDPQGVANMFPMFVAPQDIQPLMLQWKSVTASGDKTQMASFLGALSAKYPDFPFQRGAVTGLPSEFDIGDGKARLFSPLDVAQWETQIDKSPLSEDEKALRVMSLRKDGLVIPFSQKANNLDEQLAEMPEGESLATRYLYQTHTFKPRQKNLFGTRRVE